MAVEIRVPALGESIVEATVGKWLKQVGDTVAAGEALVDLETDKVNVEVAAEQGGVLEQIVKGEGQNVGVGEVIGTIGAAAPGFAAARRTYGCDTRSIQRIRPAGLAGRPQDRRRPGRRCARRRRQRAGRASHKR